MNIGIVLISHATLASEIKKVIEFIRGEESSFLCVDVEDSDHTEGIRKELEKAIKEAQRGDGVLILSDLFGATPSNLCLGLLKKGEVELISGYNLPMLLKLSQIQQNLSLEELLLFLTEYGRKHIFCPTRQCPTP
ncbi:MAG: PTS sugar transporter subunit IIA [Deltaproteobacteria bacterium]|nr:PTS sugar transporter subunit IIA [Deltaproteobacteria bacterium]